MGGVGGREAAPAVAGSTVSTRPVRVCHLVRQFHPGVGGLEAFVASLAASLSTYNCASDVVTLDRLFTANSEKLPAQEAIEDVAVTRVSMVGGRRWFLPSIDRLTLSQYDVLHVHGIDGMFERVARETKRPGQVRIATSHGGFFHTPWMARAKQLYFATITRLAARGYDRLIANSEADFLLMERLGRDVTLIANGVSPLGNFQARGRDLLYLGRLASHKHVDRLIAAMAQPSLQGSVLHIVGPEWDVTPQHLSLHAKTLGVGERVHIHGHVTSQRLAEIARDCGIFVSASAYEGFGMSLIEAMSVGLIPIAQPNPSFSELLANAPVGVLASFDTTPEAAIAIRLELDRLSDDRRAAARAFASQFNWQGHAEKTAALYRQLLNEKTAPR